MSYKLGASLCELRSLTASKQPTTKNMKEDNDTTNNLAVDSVSAGSVRCEGWRRNGGAFSLGPVEWVQCEDRGDVMLKLNQGGEISELPACQHCWNECIQTTGIEVLSAKPI